MVVFGWFDHLLSTKTWMDVTIFKASDMISSGGHSHQILALSNICWQSLLYSQVSPFKRFLLIPTRSIFGSMQTSRSKDTFVRPLSSNFLHRRRYLRGERERKKTQLTFSFVIVTQLSKTKSLLIKSILLFESGMIINSSNIKFETHYMNKLFSYPGFSPFFKNSPPSKSHPVINLSHLIHLQN